MDPFVAEVRMFPFNFAPKGWAFCDGQLMPISQNIALFSLLGTNYGGDGKVTYGLPDMQGNAPMHWGQGPGLSDHDLGEEGGSDSVTLLQSEMPSHGHTLLANSNPSNLAAPTPARSLSRSAPGTAYKLGTPTPTLVQMDTTAIGIAGSSFPHNNLMPYLTLNFCIAMQGVFPQRP